MRALSRARQLELSNTVPKFYIAMLEAKAHNHAILMTLDAFAGEPALLYDVLWLAQTKGVPVTMVPELALQKKIEVVPK